MGDGGRERGEGLVDQMYRRGDNNNKNVSLNFTNFNES